LLLTVTANSVDVGLPKELPAPKTKLKQLAGREQ